MPKSMTIHGSDYTKSASLATKQRNGRWLLARGKHAGKWLQNADPAYVAWAIDAGLIPQEALRSKTVKRAYDMGVASLTASRKPDEWWVPDDVRDRGDHSDIF